MRDYTRSVLSAMDQAWLGNLPLSQTLHLDGNDFHLVHAMPSDPLNKRLSLVTARQQDWSSSWIGCRRALMCC